MKKFTEVEGKSWFYLLILVIGMIVIAIVMSDRHHSTLEYLSYELAIAGVLMFVFWKCAEKDIFFCLLARNQIAIIESGKNPVKLVGDPTTAMIMREVKTLVNGEDKAEIIVEEIPQCIKDLDLVDGKRKHGFLESLLGMYYIGLPYKRIKRFLLVHTRMKNGLPENAPISDWLERDPIDKHEPERFLLGVALHDFIVPGVELSKGYIVNIVIQIELLLRKPVIALYHRSSSQPNKDGIYKANFYESLGDIVNTAVDNACRGMGYGPKDNTVDPDNPVIPDPSVPDQNDLDKAGFLAADKSANGKICLEIVEEINRTIVNLSGYEALSAFIPRWDLSTSEQQDLVRLREKATIERDVANLKAESENAEFAAAMAAAKKNFPNADESELIAMVRDVQTSKNISRSGLTVYAAGGANMNIAAQAPGSKKGKKP